MFNADAFSKKPLNVQDLLKYNAPQKPGSTQLLRNLEKAKHHTEVVQNPTTTGDDSDDERIPRAAHKSQQILPAQKPTTPSTRKELVPILQKKNSEAFAATGHRLAKVEQQCRHQQEEIKAKSLLIEKLYKEASHNRKSHEQEMTSLKAENNILRNKMERMMKFMEKNNLAWTDDEGLWHNKEVVYEELPPPIHNKGDENIRVKGRLPKEIDIKLIKKRIEDLNGLIEGEQDIVKGPAGAYQFRRRDPLKFTVFKDGLQIEGYPFFKYSHKDGQLILEDILDGYFPYMLREKYPEGTPFELVNEIDRTKDQFAQSGEKKPKTRALSESPDKRLRNDSNEKVQGVLNLAGNKINEGTIEAQTQNLIKELPTLGPNHESIATLKIRTETGKRTILVKALSADTIEVIYKILKEHSETQAFELWGGYPPQPYPNIDGIALEDLGISGESVFNLRPTYT